MATVLMFHNRTFVVIILANQVVNWLKSCHLQDGGEERRLSIDSQWSVTTCNDINDFKGDIDYDYYVEEANKLIIAVDTPSKTV